MVLFKRKPVRFLPPADVKDDNAEVWFIPQTGEIFTQYEEYLSRMDFYKQRRFNCQITGHSGLTFFEALKSERAGAEEVEQAFPEVLKGPVLRYVQFQVVSRIDTLVDHIFEAFRLDFYPGESVTVKLPNGERAQGVVREKTRFPHKLMPDGTVKPPTTKYCVTVDGDGDTFVDENHLFRDRKIWTKAVLRSFIKQTVTREAWNGAPWLVKPDYAAQHKIDTRIPAHLRYDTKLQERKQLQAQKRASLPQQQSPSQTPTPNGVNGTFQPGPARLPELKPSAKQSHKSKMQHAHQAPHFPQSTKHNRPILNGPEKGIFHSPVGGNPFQVPNLRNPEPPTKPVVVPEPPPPPPPPKYPIEDLQLEPRPDKVRPPLKFMCKDRPTDPDSSTDSAKEDKDKDTDDSAEDEIINHISMKSVGPLLETWDTLSVYCEIFKLDSFTFDDFVQAMHVASEETPVQLFEEVHCAVLKILVSSEADGGKVNVPLPEVEEEDDDEEDEEDEEEARSPTPEQDKPPARATRSSLAKAEAERLAAELKAAELEAAAPQIKHRAEDLLQDYEWIEHLRKRDFKDGGWERIMVGLLHQLSKEERMQDSCEELLAQLVPPDEEPTQETVLQKYGNLSLDYRVQALQIICMLTMRAKAIRAYMEDCSEQMTAYRKEKIEWQRQRKQATEELRGLNDQRKILLPDNMPSSPTPEAKAEENAKEAGNDSSVVPDKDESDSETGTTPKKNGRRLNDRALERQRKRKEELERREKAAAEAAKMPKQSKQFVKLLKDIQKKEDFIKECEEEIAVLDNDLREADCPRTRVLGKDRFWNRYYWFERNGMPYGGLPDSSTAAAEYANGCIWVQGPDHLEREGYIDLQPELQSEYKAQFDMTVPERKKMEEGSTSVYNAKQWGYLSEPEHVDALIRWLDPRGNNELKLRKELLNFREKITKNMENRKKYISPPPEEEEETKESKRGMASRTRMQKTPEPTHYRCLDWENTMAVEEFGHLHSEPPPPPRSRKPTKKRQAAEPAPEPPAPKTRRRK